jgi:redox-sensing transcriptional repressor
MRKLVSDARHIPAVTVSRLPVYLQALHDAAQRKIATVSSTDLATAAGVNSAKVRKDLSYLGSHGTRGIGYAVDELTREISLVLGLVTERAVVIVGAGNLGRALASYDGFTRRGFVLTAIVDSDPKMIGTQVGDLRVEPFSALAEIVQDRAVEIAVIAVPAHVAQEVANAACKAGVTALLNFAPTHLNVDASVSVRTVDFSSELQILSFYAQRANVAVS